MEEATPQAVPNTPQVTPPPAQPVQPPVEQPKSNKLVWLVVLIVILVVLGGFYFFLSSQQTPTTQDSTNLVQTVEALESELEALEEGNLEEDLQEIDQDLSAL